MIMMMMLTKMTTMFMVMVIDGNDDDDGDDDDYDVDNDDSVFKMKRVLPYLSKWRILVIMTIPFRLMQDKCLNYLEKMVLIMMHHGFHCFCSS